MPLGHASNDSHLSFENCKRNKNTVNLSENFRLNLIEIAVFAFSGKIRDVCHKGACGAVVRGSLCTHTVDGSIAPVAYQAIHLSVVGKLVPQESAMMRH
ncbi:hypothetical protein Y032_0003g1471 [Ancylostoma ceylanicum]|uniref:Uncharacterized protein n=1 Tax=Ancylostoma ceylanicum TaxID=53326 RepID=A0A016VXA8_9BILA|nr:hypothetical protein Y032_0003g1471 [Ancylostoma ceylanicum]